MDKRKKHFAGLSVEEQRRKPPTKAQKRNQMCTYLKNMAGFTHSQLKNKIFNEVQKAFDKTMDDDQEEAEMKKHVEIVVDVEEITVDAIPLATKPPIIVDWKIIKEGKMGYFQLIRAYRTMMEADYELAQRLQAEEQGELTIEERSKLFVELMDKRKKHFAKLRAEEIRRKPPTKA
ncbi:hypothetical protein Tco_1352284 [Tanacetum coccineum]